MTAPEPSAPDPAGEPAPEASEGAIPLSASPAEFRRRTLALTAVVLFATLSACVLSVVLASRLGLRLDVTATSAHRLSDRTASLLRTLPGEFEIVVAAELGALDPASRQRTEDVLGAFAHASARVRVTTLDTATAAGQAQFESLLARLRDRYAANDEQQAEDLRRYIGQAQAAAAGARSLGDATEELASSLDGTTSAGRALVERLNQISPRARAAGDALDRAAAEAQSLLDERLGALGLPPIDESARVLRLALGQAADGISLLHSALDEVSRLAEGSGAPGRTPGEGARRLGRSAGTLRDELARAADAVAPLGDSPALRVARTLERTRAALVLGPPPPTPGSGVVAVDFDALFPPDDPAADPQAPAPDLRFKAEELLSTALASLVNPDAPIVVLVHGEPARMSAPGDTLADAAPDLRRRRVDLLGLVDRLSLRGVDLVEWAAAIEDEPPSLHTIDPAGLRPVVYANIATDSLSAAGAMRTERLGIVLQRLVTQGEAVLLSVAPSLRPSLGSPDPLASAAAPLGLVVDSGKPVLRRQSTPEGQIVQAEWVIGSPASGHAVASALSGLGTMLLWPVPIRVAEDAPAPDQGGPTLSPLLEASGDAWGEAEWAAWWQVPREARLRAPRPPTPDEGRDLTQGPFVVAAAASVPRDDLGRTQRLVIVGSNGWFLDPVAQAGRIVQGRTIFAHPGNLELFEAAVFWLARQDDLIARSATAGAAPRIAPLSSETLMLWKIVLVLAAPAGVLLLGAALRLRRK